MLRKLFRAGIAKPEFSVHIGLFNDLELIFSNKITYKHFNVCCIHT